MKRYALLLALLLFAPLHADPFVDQSYGDVDCNGQINIGDAVFLLNYIFADGPEPNCHKTGMVEPMMIDTAWIEAYIGGDTLRRVDGLRRVYTIGANDEPRYYLLIPEDAIAVESEPTITMWKYGGNYRQPDMKKVFAEYFRNAKRMVQ